MKNQFFYQQIDITHLVRASDTKQRLNGAKIKEEVRNAGVEY